MSLELKVPPPIVALALAAAMYGAARALPEWRFGSAASGWLAAALAIVGGVVLVFAVIPFIRNKTTIDPRKPERTSTLITGGIYGWTRNPIYLADTLLLLAWAAYLGNPVAFALPIVFVFWMNAFQIRPEERILRARFGGQYEDYCRRVDRWLGRRARA